MHYDQPTSVLLLVAGSKTVYMASPSTRFPKREVTGASGARLKDDSNSAPHATWPERQNSGEWCRVKLVAGDARRTAAAKRVVAQSGLHGRRGRP